jgi:8-oxo-dGTP pyrophosphatase MutT (NUDIX family)
MNNDKSSIVKFKNKINKPLRQATLCFLISRNSVLLAMKKRGFGAGRWNGVGGKPETGESIFSAAKRETQEEIKVIPNKMRLVAKLDFYFPYIPLTEDWNQQVVVYLAEEWTGQPMETDEMKPRWYDKNKLPYDKMWADDKIWLPHVLADKKVKAEFYFGKNQNIEDYYLKVY